MIDPLFLTLEPHFLEMMSLGDLLLFDFNMNCITSISGWSLKYFFLVLNHDLSALSFNFNAYLFVASDQLYQLKNCNWNNLLNNYLVYNSKSMYLKSYCLQWGRCPSSLGFPNFCYGWIWIKSWHVFYVILHTNLTIYVNAHSFVFSLYVGMENLYRQVCLILIVKGSLLYPNWAFMVLKIICLDFP